MQKGSENISCCRYRLGKPPAVDNQYYKRNFFCHLTIICKRPITQAYKMWKVVFLLGFCLLCAYATAGLLGGFEEVDINDEEVVTAANQASRALSKQFAGKYHHKLVKVLKAKRQVRVQPLFLCKENIPGQYNRFIPFKGKEISFLRLKNQ